MTGILEMFAALDGRDRYELQLSIWAYMQRSESAERARDWRQANREHVKAYEAARPKRTHKPKRETNECRSCRNPAAPGRRSCEMHLAKAKARALRSLAARAA